MIFVNHDTRSTWSCIGVRFTQSAKGWSQLSALGCSRCGRVGFGCCCLRLGRQRPVEVCYHTPDTASASIMEKFDPPSPNANTCSHACFRAHGHIGCIDLGNAFAKNEECRLPPTPGRGVAFLTCSGMRFKQRMMLQGRRHEAECTRAPISNYFCNICRSCVTHLSRTRTIQTTGR